MGEPDFVTPWDIRSAAIRSLQRGYTQYTGNRGLPELREKISRYLEERFSVQYPPERVIVTVGASEGIDLVLRAVCEAGDEILVPDPAYVSYAPIISLCGGVPVSVKCDAENGFIVTPRSLKEAITPRTKALILAYPNNPTGAVYSKEEFAALARVLEKYGDIYIISDEIYENLVYDGAETVSFALYSNEIKNRTILVNGVSKTFSMTGWRIGYTASNRELARAMSSMQSHMTSNPNSIAQYATEIAFNDIRGEQFVQSMQTQFGERRKLIIDELKKSETLSVVEPEGAFYCLVCVKSRFGKSADGVVIDSAKKFAETLLEKEKVAVIPCESFGAPDYIRLSYAISPRDIERGVKRLVRFADGLK